MSHRRSFWKAVDILRSLREEKKEHIVSIRRHLNKRFEQITQDCTYRMQFGRWRKREKIGCHPMDGSIFCSLCEKKEQNT
jgi:hypothetical protein